MRRFDTSGKLPCAFKWHFMLVADFRVVFNLLENPQGNPKKLANTISTFNGFPPNLTGFQRGRQAKPAWNGEETESLQTGSGACTEAPFVRTYKRAVFTSFKLTLD